MDLLKRSGFDFKKHKTQGIPSQMLGEYLITSGICLNPNTHWITFHGGIDFGYLLRVLIGSDLPKDEAIFFDNLNCYFQNFYDIKEIKRDYYLLQGGLSKIAKELEVDRIGTNH